MNRCLVFTKKQSNLKPNQVWGEQRLKQTSRSKRIIENKISKTYPINNADYLSYLSKGL